MSAHGRARLARAAVVAVVFGATVGASACAKDAADGVISGHIAFSGGPAGQVKRSIAEPGRVIIETQKGVVTSRTVRYGRTFRVPVSAGSYRVVAHSGDAQCKTARIDVRAHKTTDVVLLCSVR